MKNHKENEAKKSLSINNKENIKLIYCYDSSLSYLLNYDYEIAS